MDYRELLEKQVKRHLTDAVSQLPEVQDFIREISSSYDAFQKEKQLLTRAFKITEEEYREININLNNEINNRKETIHYLSQALSSYASNAGLPGDESLMDLSSKLVDEIEKRQSIQDTFRSLINNLNLGILLKDASGQYVYANKTFYEIFNFQMSIPDEPGDEISALLSGMRSRCTIRDCFIRPNRDFEFNIISETWHVNDGRIIEENTIPYLYGENQRGCIYTYSDITQKEEANELIRKSELRNNQILRGSPNSVVLVDAGGFIRFTNEKTLDVYGFSTNEVLGRDLCEILNLQDVLPNGFAQIECMDGENDILNRNFEIETTRKDGHILWIELTIIKMERTNDASYCCFSRDITARKLAEREIIKQKKFTEDILDNIPNDIAVFDQFQNYLFVNRKAVKNADMRKWLIGKNDFDYCAFKNTDPSVAIKRSEAFRKCIDSGENVEWIDTHIDNEGNVEYFQRKYHAHAENGDIQFVIGYGMDITKNVINQKQLESTLELTNKINSELEYFVYIASHDLQEPLRTIVFLLSRIEKSINGLVDEKAMNYIQLAINSAKRMRELILDLLAYSRIDQGRNEALLSIDLNELVQDIIEMHHSQVEELSAVIKVDALPVVHYQKSFLRQIFQNLISNALKYHKENVPPVITVSSSDLGSHWQFSVADNGIGIAEEYFDKIFVIFQRLNNDDKYTGTGIGLAITKKIIEVMNGKIWLESNINLGSTFYFTLLKN